MSRWGMGTGYKMAAALGSSLDLRKFVKFGRKVVAVGRNYRYGKRCLKFKRKDFRGTRKWGVLVVSFLREHAAELGNPVPKSPLIFFKPPSSYLEQGGKIKVSWHFLWIFPPCKKRESRKHGSWSMDPLHGRARPMDRLHQNMGQVHGPPVFTTILWLTIIKVKK